MKPKFVTMSVLFVLAAATGISYAQGEPPPQTPRAVDLADLGLKILGLGGAVVAFLIGLRQYKRSEQWKRAEFVANELKEFNANPGVGLAMSMIDWGSRTLPLFTARDFNNRTRVLVTRQIQCRALLPHTVVEPLKGSDVEASGEGAFSKEESAIRDSYDSFLDGLERMGSWVSSGLVGPDELDPYIGYWIRDIAAPTDDPEDAAWNACLFMYIDTYGYEKVRELFLHFGYDITPEGALYRRFVEGIRDVQLRDFLQVAEQKRAHVARS